MYQYVVEVVVSFLNYSLRQALSVVELLLLVVLLSHHLL